MTDKEKYDFIDHVVHLALVEEDRLLNEHGGKYSRLKEDGIDSNEYYRIITERVINILKKNNKYMQEEPVSEDFEEACEQLAENARIRKAETISRFFSPTDYKQGVIDGTKWKEQQMMAKAIDGEVGYWNQRGLSVLMNLPSEFEEDDKCKIILIKEE